MLDRYACTLLLLLLFSAGCTTLGIEADPHSLDFGVVPVDSEVIDTVLLVNRGPDASLIIATVGGPFSAHGADRVDLAQDEAIEVVIRAFPRSSGVAEGALQVVAGRVSYSIPLRVEGSLDGLDGDRDGFTSNTDCDDEDPAIHPDAEELCDGVDNNCDGLLSDEELDSDGDGFAGCEGDCDDGDGAINPDAIEQCDEVDHDCDGDTGEVDADGDGVRGCDGDCDDDDADINPDADEVCDEVDNDCDGDIDEGYDPETCDPL